MKFDKQIFRKVLWAPTAVFSVSITLYLANLWLSQNSPETMLNKIDVIPEVEDKEKTEKASPANASEEGEDEETVEQEEDATQQEKQTPPPPAPVPPAQEASQEQESSEEQKSKDEKSPSKNNNGNTDLEEYIAAKIKDMNLNGKE